MDKTEEKVPESPTGAWIISKVYSAHGIAIDLKASGTTLRAAIDDLYAGIAYGIETYKWSTEAPKLPDAPAQKVQLRDEAGLPVVNQEGEPEMVDLPPGVRMFNTKALFHDKSRDGSKDLLKVITVEEPYNTKYGVACFHGGPEGWQSWPVGVENKYAPPKGFTKVAIRDPKEGEKYANVERFE